MNNFWDWHLTFLFYEPYLWMKTDSIHILVTVDIDLLCRCSSTPTPVGGSDAPAFTQVRQFFPIKSNVLRLSGRKQARSRSPELEGDRCSWAGRSTSPGVRHQEERVCFKLYIIHFDTVPAVCNTVKTILRLLLLAVTYQSYVRWCFQKDERVHFKSKQTASFYKCIEVCCFTLYPAEGSNYTREKVFLLLRRLVKP